MPRRIRVFVDYEEQLRRAFTIGVTNRDASIYLQPSSASGVFHYGRGAFPPGVESTTFNFKGQLSAEQEPHISLHQSGEVHVRTRGGPKAGPVRIVPLSELRGEHVATVGAVTFRGFPPFSGDRKSLHPEFDRIVMAEGVDSGRLAIHLNGEAPTFSAPKERIAFTVTIHNVKLLLPLFLAVATWSQQPLSDSDDDEGAIAIAGFDPSGQRDDFLFLVGS